MSRWMLPLVLGLITVAPQGEIAKLYRDLVGDKPANPARSRSGDQVLSSEHGITEIGLERTPCFGTCPVYSAVIRSDGSVSYHGLAYVDRKGERTGHVNAYDFNQLAQFVAESGYMEMEDRYGPGNTDTPSAFTTVVTKGKRRVVLDEDNRGPVRLWAIERLVDDLVSRAAWDPEKPGVGKK